MHIIPRNTVDKLNDQMTDIDRSLANLMKVVEEGFKSETVEQRIKELEKEKKHINSKLFDITACSSVNNPAKLNRPNRIN